MAASCATVVQSLGVGTAKPHASSLATPSYKLPWRYRPSRLPSRLAFSPTMANSAGRRSGAKFVAMATEESFEAQKVATEALKDLQEAWDKTDDKLALGSLGFGFFLLLWISAGIVNAIDKLPLIPSFFELVGILFSVWFIYRYLLFKPDREELFEQIQDILAKITGSSNDE